VHAPCQDISCGGGRIPNNKVDRVFISYSVASRVGFIAEDTAAEIQLGEQFRYAIAHCMKRGVERISSPFGGQPILEILHARGTNYETGNDIATRRPTVLVERRSILARQFACHACRSAKIMPWESHCRTGFRSKVKPCAAVLEPPLAVRTPQ